MVLDTKTNRIYKVAIYKGIQKSCHPRRAGLRNTKLYNGALISILDAPSVIAHRARIRDRYRNRLIQNGD